jgi:hypothetical protein
MSAFSVKPTIPSKTEQKKKYFVFASSHSEGYIHGDIPVSKVVSARYRDICNFGNMVE